MVDPMAKRIALFCDGTWNFKDQPYPTNVWRLYESTAQIEHEQACEYLEGVGRKRHRLLGGLAGVGLNNILLEAYLKLCTAYEPGARIFLFGFSRGAYVARSLAGMMRACGVLAPDKLHLAPEALAIYRRRGVKPDRERALEFRARNAIAQYEGDEAVKAGKGLSIAYMGLWETVGALGVPQRIPFSAIFNRGLRFHDADVSRMVRRARHCIAIDETRNALPNTPWTGESIRRVNEAYGEGSIEQVWFPGDHGAVGGGGLRDGLSHEPLLWVAEAAEEEGLVFDDAKGQLQRAAEEQDPVNGMLKSDGNDFWLRVQGLGPRLAERPRTLDDVSAGLRERARERPRYLLEDSLKGVWRRETLNDVLGPLLCAPQPNDDEDAQGAAAAAPELG